MNLVTKLQSHLVDVLMWKETAKQEVYDIYHSK